MSNFIEYYEYAKLANAAYVDLNEGLSGSAIATAVNSKRSADICRGEGKI